jgi:transglutaminase-like putative cysteine protease
MGIRVALSHVTRYRYDRPVTLGPHTVRLRPAPHARTPIHAYSLRVEPADQFLNWQQDPYSNHLARLVFPKPAAELTVTVELVAEMVPINPFDFFIDEAAETYPFAYEPALARELTPYLETLPAGPRLRDLVASCRRNGVRTIDYLVGLNQAVQRHVGYVIRMEPGVQTPEETLDLRRGSCRDSAWLLVQLARHLGLAARFVSGYLVQLVADEKPIEGPDGPPADFTDLHAWAELYVPGAGWIGLDPTSGLLAAEGHIPLACTADPQTAAPISGSYSWAKRGDADKVVEEFDHDMRVTRLDERPRVTKPYTDAQWAAIDALGRRVDADLREWDVRLTMGGEPTFVSTDDRDADEWNTAALGPNKRRQAVTLLKRLRDRFAPQGLLHFGQGKWYPGEQLPRWAFGCWWRRDGEPVWTDPGLVADERVRYGFGANESGRFVTRLAEILGVNPGFALPGYEDAWYYLWRERRLPANVDPFDSKLDDEQERARLARVFEQKLGTVVGHMLPVRRAFGAGSRWESGAWFLRKERLYLIPGDSPMGLRLPLDGVYWEDPAARQFMAERDPFAPRGPLPPAYRPASGGRQPPELQFQGVPRFRDEAWGANGVSASRLGDASRLGGLTPPARQDYDPSIVRTALCVEPRGGVMHVFMPPLRLAEDYLDLVAAVEADRRPSCGCRCWSRATSRRTTRG